MSTLKEISFSILETVRPKASITEPITLELIKFHVKNTRAQLIRQELNKSRSVDNEIIQDLGCIDLVKVDRSECCSTDIGCVFLRTSIKIPGFIELNQKPLITRIGPVDKISKPWQLIQYERVPFEFLNKFTKNEIKVFLMNNNDYIYLAIHEDNILKKTLKKINIQGVLEDPEKASTFNQCSGQVCFSDNSNFPVKDWMINSIKDLVIKTFIGPESKQPIDYSNNQKSDFSPQTE